MRFRYGHRKHRGTKRGPVRRSEFKRGRPTWRAMFKRAWPFAKKASRKRGRGRRSGGSGSPVQPLAFSKTSKMFRSARTIERASAKNRIVSSGKFNVISAQNLTNWGSETFLRGSSTVSNGTDLYNLELAVFGDLSYRRQFVVRSQKMTMRLVNDCTSIVKAEVYMLRARVAMVPGDPLIFPGSYMTGVGAAEEGGIGTTHPAFSLFESSRFCRHWRVERKYSKFMNPGQSVSLQVTKMLHWLTGPKSWQNVNDSAKNVESIPNRTWSVLVRLVGFPATDPTSPTAACIAPAKISCVWDVETDFRWASDNLRTNVVLTNAVSPLSTVANPQQMNDDAGVVSTVVAA